MEADLKQNVIVLENHEAVSRETADIFVKEANAAVTERGRFIVALSGGSSPERFFEILADDLNSEIDWENINVFWADERCVPPDHAESNFGNAYRILLSKVPSPETNIHRIRGEEDPVRAAGLYEKELRSVFGNTGVPVFDLIVLGMGKDGHTASLFPGSPVLEEKTRLAVPSFAEHLGSWRISLTLSVINNAKRILFIVSGKSKAAALAKVLEGRQDPVYPASLVRSHAGEIMWIIDKDAASLLGRLS